MLFLFTFTRYKNDGLQSGVDTVWRYNAGDYPIDFRTTPAQIFEPEQIKWSSFALDGERLDQALQIDLPRDNPIVALYSAGAPSRPIWLTIEGAELVAKNGADEFEALVTVNGSPTPPARRTLFKGRIKSVTFNDLTATIQLTAVGDLLKRQGLRTSFSATCNKVFGPSTCGVDIAAVEPLPGQSVASVSADGLSITLAAGFSDDTYSAGLAYYAPPAGSDPSHYYTIARQLGAVLTLTRPIPNLAAGSVLTLRKGCLKTKEACLAYANTVNFGGFPNIPNRNPFVKV